MNCNDDKVALAAQQATQHRAALKDQMWVSRQEESQQNFVALLRARSRHRRRLHRLPKPPATSLLERLP